MMRYAELTGVLRFWDDGADANGTHDAFLVVQWEEHPHAVTVSGFGDFHITRKLICELAEWMQSRGITRMRTTRERGRVMLLGKPQGDGTFLHSIEAISAYCAEPDDRRRYPPGVEAPARASPAPRRRRGETEWQDTIPIEPRRELEDHERATEVDIEIQRGPGPKDAAA